ncbi:MAG TPA: N-6 DNA methylase [Pyrinomonadaceae bacterium]|nr:N-6 DNA methylase [Pyrinomonadaceae bacterium]
MAAHNASASAVRRIATQQSLNNTVWNVCKILRRSNCAGALQYIPELTWLLFLRILDEREEIESLAASDPGRNFRPSLEAPYRWRDWAAPLGPKRIELQNGAEGNFFKFVNAELFPYLKGLHKRAGATARQKVISEVMSSVERVRIDTEENLLEVLDKLDQINSSSIDPTHIFALSQVYEGLLLKMGAKSNDGGQFFTPREIIRAMVRAVAPQPGETVYDPCCGTGGFLVQSYEFMSETLGPDALGQTLADLKHRTFYGREKEDLIYPVALANLVLHGIDHPHIWHGNTLTGRETYGGFFEGAPRLFDVVLTNPPFGGQESKKAQKGFRHKANSTQLLFLQHVVDSLKPGGRCGIVLDEGVLFRTNQTAFVETKRKLLDECDLWCIISLPEGVFANAGAGVKTDLLFFTKGRATEKIWYYDLSDIRMGKKNPLTYEHFDDFFRYLPQRADSERSWTVTRREIEARNFDLKAVNPRARKLRDPRSPEELLALIDVKNQIVFNALAKLRNLPGGEIMRENIK